MAIDHVELLTREIRRVEESHPRDAQDLLDSLSVKQPTHKNQPSFTDSIMESVATEAQEPALPGEGPIIRALLNGLNWATFALAIGAVLF